MPYLVNDGVGERLTVMMLAWGFPAPEGRRGGWGRAVLAPGFPKGEAPRPFAGRGASFEPGWTEAGGYRVPRMFQKWVHVPETVPGKTQSSTTSGFTTAWTGTQNSGMAKYSS